MTPPSRVIVGLGLGQDEGALVERGLRLALGSGAELTLIHVTPQQPADAVDSGAREQLESIAHRLRAAGARCHTELFAGAPERELVRAALREDADLILVGRAPRGPIDLLVGCATETLLRLSPVPVWIVDPERSTHTSDSGVLAAVALDDRLDRDDQTIRMARAIAAHRGVPLHVAHVVEEWRPPFASLDGHASALLDAARHSARAALVRNFSGPDGLADHVHVPHGRPAIEVRALVQTHHIGLLVMGAPPRQGLLGRLLGGTVESLLHEPPCELLSVQPPSFVTPVPAPSRSAIYESMLARAS